MKLSIGIDIGSTSSEMVIMNRGYEILHLEESLTGTDLNKTANMLLSRSLRKTRLNLNEVSSIVATGYGRKQIDFSTFDKTEISCYARGAVFFNNKIQTIIDIGGQDSKAISIDEAGKVKNFTMNDKCAAGTGKFLEMISKRFDIGLDEIGPLSLRSKKQIQISSICAVFAESEIISLLSSGEKIEDIINAAHKALCERVLGMSERIGIKEEIMFCGGVAKNSGMVEKMKDSLGKQLFVPQYMEYVGAIGAALLGLENNKVC